MRISQRVPARFCNTPTGILNVRYKPGRRSDILSTMTGAFQIAAPRAPNLLRPQWRLAAG